MSELFDHIADHFARGHQQDLDDLHDHARFAPANVREAAVLVAITERSEPGVILTQRPQDMRQHPGQVAFPGGKLDPGEDAITAALREADEELALPSGNVRVIGQSDRFITGTGYDITPVIGLVPPDLDLRPNPREVSHWFEAPLGFILDPANHAHKSTLFDGQERDYIEIMWQEHRIWGVTAAIIANLSRRLETMGFSR